MSESSNCQIIITILHPQTARRAADLQGSQWPDYDVGPNNGHKEVLYEDLDGRHTAETSADWNEADYAVAVKALRKDTTYDRPTGKNAPRLRIGTSSDGNGGYDFVDEASSDAAGTYDSIDKVNGGHYDFPSYELASAGEHPVTLGTAGYYGSPVALAPNRASSQASHE